MEEKRSEKPFYVTSSLLTIALIAKRGFRINQKCLRFLIISDATFFPKKRKKFWEKLNYSKTKIFFCLWKINFFSCIKSKNMEKEKSLRGRGDVGQACVIFFFSEEIYHARFLRLPASKLLLELCALFLHLLFSFFSFSLYFSYNEISFFFLNILNHFSLKE